MNMKKTLKGLVYAAFKNDATKFQDHARQAIMEKTKQALENKKREVAKSVLENE